MIPEKVTSVQSPARISSAYSKLLPINDSVFQFLIKHWHICSHKFLYRISNQEISDQELSSTMLYKLFVSCHYHHFLFVCLAPVVFKVNTANIQYFWIFLEIQIMQNPLCTAVLTTIFFHDYSYQKYGLFFSFVDS